MYRLDAEVQIWHSAHLFGIHSGLHPVAVWMLSARRGRSRRICCHLCCRRGTAAAPLLLVLCGSTTDSSAYSACIASHTYRIPIQLAYHLKKGAFSLDPRKHSAAPDKGATQTGSFIYVPPWGHHKEQRSFSMAGRTNDAPNGQLALRAQMPHGERAHLC